MKRVLLIVSALFLLSGTARAQGKVGYVDSQRIFSELPEFKEAEAKFNKEVEDWEDQAAIMKAEIDSLTDEKERNSLVWSAAKKKEVEDRLTAKQDTLQQFWDITFGPGGKAERRMNELSQPLKERVIAVIRRIAIEKDYDVVLDAAVVSIAFAKESLDLTDDVISEISKEN
ncbi:MAG: OmpH family outer membrane protein [Candidatus Zixiibacteriota bacterium]|nr:MAG: OmpH family outer membrane protein [candidate division Zixibacteria bacterium]